VIISVENIGKRYKLGEYNLSSALSSLRKSLFGGNDLVIENDRTKAGGDYIWALENINFNVGAGEVLGIIGKNGAGKSTLLKVLSRVTAPSVGSIKIKGRVGSLLEVGTGFHPDLTGRENIFLNGAILGMNKSEIKAKFDEIVDFAGVQKYIETPVKRYSSGMYVRLAFAVAEHLEPEILIVDEVLAVGDSEFQEKCVGKMKTVSGEGRTVLFVSHNMGTIRHLCTRGILLQNGKMTFDGNIEETIDKYLRSNSKLLSDGTVPSGASIQNSGEGRITKVILRNESGENTNDYFYGSPIQLSLNYSADIELEKCLIGVQIKNSLNESIQDFVNLYDNADLVISKGENQFNISMVNALHPGKYFINITVARFNGVPLDSLESISEITVSNLGERADSGYPFGWTNGYLKGIASWSKKWKIKISLLPGVLDLFLMRLSPT
jgi:lipopolysaccharide transport system ATP-binding protein